MLEFLRTQKFEVENEIKDLYEQRRKAGVDSSGNIDNRLQNLRIELEKLTKELQDEEKKYKTTGELNILLCVIVSTRETVKANIGNECLCNLEEDRYDDKVSSNWKPFKGCGSIQQILSEFGKKYRFNEKYFDGDIPNEEIVWIEDNITNIIAVIDLLSLNEANLNNASYFDSKESKVIFPLCYSLPISVREQAEKKKSIFRKLNARVNELLPCNLYSDVSGVESFKAYLAQIFSINFKITNRSTIDSPVRSMNMHLQ